LSLGQTDVAVQRESDSGIGHWLYAVEIGLTDAAWQGRCHAHNVVQSNSFSHGEARQTVGVH
jgi:hypothetical protein